MEGKEGGKTKEEARANAGAREQGALLYLVLGDLDPPSAPTPSSCNLLPGNLPQLGSQSVGPEDLELLRAASESRLGAFAAVFLPELFKALRLRHWRK